MTTPKTDTVLTMLGEVPAPVFPSGAGVMTALVEIPPGSPGSPPHRHSGPVFGYVTEGEMLLPAPGPGRQRVLTAGDLVKRST